MFQEKRKYQKERLRLAKLEMDILTKVALESSR